jgi:hypothetical protein
MQSRAVWKVGEMAVAHNDGVIVIPTNLLKSGENISGIAQ